MFNIIEFSDSSALKGAWVFGPTTGNNTLYTCPAGKTAYSVSFATAFAARSVVTYGSGGTPPGTGTISLVKSGGSPSLTIQSVAIANANTISNALNGILGCITVGDSFVVNAVTGDPAQIIFGMFIEMPN